VSARWLALAIACCCAASAHAAVPRLDDVRLFGAWALGDDCRVEGHLDQEVPSVSSRHETISVGEPLDYHRRFGVGWYRSEGDLRPSVGSFAYAGEIAYDTVRMTGPDKEIDGRTAMIDAFAGWAWALTPEWHLEEGVLLGVGESRWEWEADVGSTPWKSTSTDLSYEYGFRVGSAWTFANGLQLGLDLRHLLMRSSADFRRRSESTGLTVVQSYRPEIEIRGFGVLALIGYRF
jgi:hypothetical protein